MQDIKLFKKLSNYTDKDGNEKTATNLYLQCGDSLVPIEVKYFPDKDTKIDPNFRGRKMVISAFAEDLPEKASDKKKINLNKPCPNCHKKMRVDDKDLDQNGQGSVWFICDECGTSVISRSGCPDNVDFPEDVQQKVKTSEKGEKGESEAILNMPF